MTGDSTMVVYNSSLSYTQHVPGVSKKYGVADYQYFENGKTQQCDIFRRN